MLFKEGEEEIICHSLRVVENEAPYVYIEQCLNDFLKKYGNAINNVITAWSKEENMK